MSEQDTGSTATEHDNKRIDDALREFESKLHDHGELTKGELSKIHRELTDALTEARNADKAEKDELRQAIAKVSKWQEDEDKARAEKDKIKSSSTTIVSPPENLVPPPPIEPTVHDTGGDGEGGGKKGWKKIW